MEMCNVVKIVLYSSVTWKMMEICVVIKRFFNIFVAQKILEKGDMINRVLYISVAWKVMEICNMIKRFL